VEIDRSHTSKDAKISLWV